MKPIRTVCARDCYDSCGLIVQFNEAGEIQPVTGDPTHPITRGFTCPRGRKDHKRIFENRVERPFRRQAGGFETSDWETAMETVARKLRHTLDTHGPEAVLFLNYAGNLGLLAASWPERLWNAMGATRVDGAVCSKSGHAALGLHFGASYGMPPEDLLASDLIVFWGFNAVVSSPHLWNLAIAVRSAHGTPIIAIDPRKSETAKRADLWISPKPGTDVALAYGVIRALIQTGSADLSFLSQWSVGFDRLAEAARHWTPDRVEDISGVPEAELAALVERYRTGKQPATMIGIGMQKQDSGADAVRTIAFIPAALGQHRGFFYGNGAAHGVDRDLITGRSLVSSSRTTSQVALADRIDQGDFKFVYVNCHNPALTLPRAGAIQEGLQREDVFVAVHETHWTRTAKLADVVLPAPTHFEKADILVPWGHAFVQLLPRVMAPVTDSRSEVDVMTELAQRLGLENQWLFEDPWQTLEKAFSEALADGDFKDLMAGRRLRLRSKAADRYDTPSGKIEFYPSRLPSGVTPLPEQPPQADTPGGFRLLNSALPHYTHTQFQEVYGPIPTRLAINSEDADRLEIKNGETVWIGNDQGEIRMQVFRSETVPPGILWSPRQSEDSESRSFNGLMPSIPQRLGNGPRFNGIQVRIYRKTSGT